MTNRNKNNSKALSAMKKRGEDPFVPRSFATLDPYKDGMPKGKGYNAGSLNGRSS